MEYFDVVDENGMPVGEIISREKAHREGIQHRTAHVWIVRKKDSGYDVLLQKRSRNKDSFPGMYDTSSAGHIPAGEEPLPSALRELKEELGIEAGPEDLRYAGMFHGQYEKEFHGHVFRDNEIARVYVYDRPVAAEELTLQESEVEEVRYFDLEEAYEESCRGSDRFCVNPKGMKVLMDYLDAECE